MIVVQNERRARWRREMAAAEEAEFEGRLSERLALRREMLRKMVEEEMREGEEFWRRYAEKEKRKDGDELELVGGETE